MTNHSKYQGGKDTYQFRFLLLVSKVHFCIKSKHEFCLLARSLPLPPENTFLLVLSNARQKMLDRCSPFSLSGLAREWMAFSICHSSTRRSSPPGANNKRFTFTQLWCDSPTTKTIFKVQSWTIRPSFIQSSLTKQVHWEGLSAAVLNHFKVIAMDSSSRHAVTDLLIWFTPLATGRRNARSYTDQHR